MRNWRKLCIRTHPEFDKTYAVDIDVSNVGFGGVLSQMKDRKQRVIVYFSNALTRQERIYCVICRKLPAVVKTLHFDKYRYGYELVLRTSVASLKWVLCSSAVATTAAFDQFFNRTSKWQNTQTQLHFHTDLDQKNVSILQWQKRRNELKKYSSDTTARRTVARYCK